jgi:hypothetical protein
MERKRAAMRWLRRTWTAKIPVPVHVEGRGKVFDSSVVIVKNRYRVLNISIHRTWSPAKTGPPSDRWDRHLGDFVEMMQKRTNLCK